MCGDGDATYTRVSLAITHNTEHTTDTSRYAICACQMDATHTHAHVLLQVLRCFHMCMCVHVGVTCDYCCASPIVGDRYVCTVCHDLDLCARYDTPHSTCLMSHAHGCTTQQSTAHCYTDNTAHNVISFDHDLRHMRWWYAYACMCICECVYACVCTCVMCMLVYV